MTDEQALLREAFESSPPLLQLLSTVRTRRMGLGYRYETGEAETQGWSTGRTITQAEGPLAYTSSAPPAPLSEIEEAVIAWAACGPNGVVLADVPVQGGLAGLLGLRGRTVPASSNDGSVRLLVVNDAGVSLYDPRPEHAALVEITGPDDYPKILDFYRQGRVQVADRRPDIGWMTAPEGTHAVNAMGPGQYNLNRAGSTWFLPVGDVGLEWFNQLLVSYEWGGFYLLDPATGKAAGCEEWIKPGFLEIGFPVPVFDESALVLHAGQAGCIVQNIRLACEALGLGAWTLGSYADDMVLGAYPEVARGLGFSFAERDPATNPSQTVTCLGLPGVIEPVVVPSKRFPTAADAVRHVVELRYGKGGFLARDDNWVLANDGPYAPGVMEEVLESSRAHISDWAVEAAIATVEYIVERYGCCPAYVSPVRAKLSVQAHHVDAAFYDKLLARAPGDDGDGARRPFGLPPAFVEHFARWHPGEADPTGGAR